MINQENNDNVYGKVPGEKQFVGLGDYKNTVIQPNTNNNGGTHENNGITGKWQQYGNDHNKIFGDTRLSSDYPKYKKCINASKDYMEIYRKRYNRFGHEKCNTTDIRLDDKKYLNGNVFMLFKVESISSASGFTNEEGFTEEQELNRFY